MSPNKLRTQTSDSQSHSGRRRHAAPGHPKWVRTAGLVGGVVSALAIGGAAAPALADNSHHHAKAATAAATKSVVTATPTAADIAQQSTAVNEQQAMAASLAAAQHLAAVRAAEDAATTKKADDAKAAAAKAAAAKAAATKAAAAKAAQERADAKAAASRSAARAKLTVIKASSSTGSGTATPTSSSSSSSSKVDQLIAFLKAQIDKPYVYGATGPSSYDCSGLTQAAFASIGIDLPRTSQEQSTVGTPVSMDSLQAGDLVFWGGEGSAYHVGVYIGGGNYLDAANPSSPVGIKPLTYSEPDWAVRVL